MKPKFEEGHPSIKVKNKKAMLILVVLVSLAAGGKQETNALLYLKKFGYIATNDGTEALVTEDNIQDYIQQGVR